jgi:flagellar biosynthetic protein FliQ
MSQDLVIQIFRELLRNSMVLMGPVLLVSLGIGLLVSIFQAATQIHEMTLVFVPKIIGIGIVLAILFPWMINTMVTYTATLFANIPMYVR